MDQEPKDQFPVGTGESFQTEVSRSFTYFYQDLNGSTPIWKEMVEKLKSPPGGINGLIDKEGGTIVWSDTAPSHPLLKQAFKEQHNADISVQMDAQVDERGVKRISLYSPDVSLYNKWRDYLVRCGIEPQLVQRANI